MIGLRGAVRLGVTLAALACSLTLQAATLGGRLGYPSEELPAMTVVARDAAGMTYTTETKVNQPRYRLEVPAGTYVVYAVPLGIGEKPGERPVRGAHTEYSVCGRDKARMLAGRCRTGPLVAVRLAASDRREDVDVDDWYLPDALVVTLGLPQMPFAKYPADTRALPATRAPDFDTAPAGARPHRPHIERAAARGPGFAGRVAVARWSCGARCENWALADMVSGRIVWIDDKALQPLRRDIPCDADVLEYREDSRLLRVHRVEGGRVVTQDFLWSNDPPRLDRSAESTRSVEPFCRR